MIEFMTYQYLLNLLVFTVYVPMEVVSAVKHILHHVHGGWVAGFKATVYASQNSDLPLNQ